jgi:hypothetical protein
MVMQPEAAGQSTDVLTATNNSPDLQKRLSAIARSREDATSYHLWLTILSANTLTHKFFVSNENKSLHCNSLNPPPSLLHTLRQALPDHQLIVKLLSTPSNAVEPEQPELEVKDKVTVELSNNPFALHGRSAGSVLASRLKNNDHQQPANNKQSNSSTSLT